MASRRIYRVSFLSQGQVYEIYARRVTQGGLLGFVEIEGVVFGERSQLVIDPSEERLAREFTGVKRSYLPMHAVLRIDEVERAGPSRITEAPARAGNVTPFPLPLPGPGKTPES